MQNHKTDPIETITPDRARQELAKIFAAGILRMRMRGVTAQPDGTSEKVLESENQGLESR
jgi:hypothetical protein